MTILYQSIDRIHSDTERRALQLGIHPSPLFYQDQAWYDRRENLVTSITGFQDAARRAYERSPAPFVMFNREWIRQTWLRDGVAAAEAYHQLRLDEDVIRDVVPPGVEQYASWAMPVPWIPDDAPETSYDLNERVDVCSVSAYHNDRRTWADTHVRVVSWFHFCRKNWPNKRIIVSVSPLVVTNQGPEGTNRRIATFQEWAHHMTVLSMMEPQMVDFWSNAYQPHVKIWWRKPPAVQADIAHMHRTFLQLTKKVLTQA